MIIVLNIWYLKLKILNAKIPISVLTGKPSLLSDTVHKLHAASFKFSLVPLVKSAENTQNVPLTEKLQTNSLKCNATWFSNEVV